VRSGPIPDMLILKISMGGTIDKDNNRQGIRQPGQERAGALSLGYPELKSSNCSNREPGK